MSKVEYFIGGAGDKGDWISLAGGATNIMKAVSLNRARTSADIDCIYRGHEQEREILSDIKKQWQSGKYKSIRITGHSWGGKAAMDLAQDLFNSGVPVDELITLDPISMFPFGKIPIAGNLLSGIVTLPTLVTNSGKSGGYIANVGGQLGAENGAHNIEIDAPHADAQTMYNRARKEMVNAPLGSRVIGTK
ncbi:MAG: hypothetical protein L3J98_00405 [Gammaproteobacteria bacterium]|nr:hypothetical protein [Gammaproteobacteria bacterium]